MKRRLSALLCALTLALSLSGCWSGDVSDDSSGDFWEETPPVEADTSSTLTPITSFALPYLQGVTLDPITCPDGMQQTLGALLYEGLFVLDESFAPQNVLCSRYEHNDDCTSYTFYLRDGVSFSDGSSLTASDVLATLRRAQESERYSARFANVASMRASNGALIVNLTRADSAFPALLDIPIVRDTSADAKPEPPEAEAPEGVESSEAAESPEDEEGVTEESRDAPAEGSAEKPAEEHTEAPKEDETPPAPEEPAQPVGTGPYRYASATRLERFDGWWQEGAPLADFPYISLYTAETSAEIRDHFEYEDINLVQTDPNSSAYVNFHNDYELWTAPTTVMQYIGYNLNSNVFSNYGLRSAITYAIDRETLVTEQAGGFATASSLPCPPQAPFYDARQANSYSYSPSRFHEQLESASVKDMDGDGVLDLYVTSLGYAVPVSGTMLVCSSSYQRVQTASAIVSALNALGFDLTLKSVDTSEFRQLLALGSFDLYYGEVRLSANFDLSSFFRFGGSLAYGALADNYMENLCHLALANNGNNYNLYERLCGRGYITPVLFKNYAIYTTRGSVADPSGYLDWFLPQRPTTEQE